MSDLAERLEHLKARNDAPSDDDAKAIFLKGLYEGLTKSEAAKAVGRTPTWFRRRCNPAGANYDADFAEAYDKAVRANKEELAEDVFTAMIKSAKEGNVRAQEKALAHLSEEWSWLKPQILQGNVNIEQVKVYLSGVPDSLLDQMIEAARAEQKALPPIIDA